METKYKKSRGIAYLFIVTSILVISNHTHSQNNIKSSEVTIWKSIGINEPVYFVDTVLIDNPIVLMDKITNFCFVKSGNDIELEKLSKSSSKNLLSTGWALLLESWQINFIITARPHQYSLRAFYSDYYLKYDLKEYKGQHLKKYEVYTLVPEPSCFFLFMMKGRVIYDRTSMVLDGGWGEIKFKDDDAYYPVLLPGYPHDLE